MNAKIYYTFKFNTLLARFLIKLLLKKSFLKTTNDSRDIYERYDDREQNAWENDTTICLWHGKIKQIPIKNIRAAYLQHICNQINIIKPKRILEIGCGNCINLVTLKKKYGDDIELYGIDIAQNRISVAKQYFKDALDGVHLQHVPITDVTSFEDGYFDLVFSMHCLEQIPYQTIDALKEMHRITNNKIVMIEPVFENGNPAQMLYLILNDHNRILKKSIEQLTYKLDVCKTIEVQSNPLNQSSLIVINK